MHTVRMFGLSFSRLSRSEAIETLSIVASAKGRKLVFTPNVDGVVLLDMSVPYREAYRAADFVFADGMPLVWFSRLIGHPIPERVTGADLVPGLCEIAARKGLKVFMLGGAPDVTPDAADILRKRNTCLEIVGVSTPPLNFEDDDEINSTVIESINRVSPDILFIALGAPRQEVWAYRHRDQLDVGFILGVGGAFDFMAGRLNRAPEWVQKSGFEWLWRLVHEPKRLWKRYLVRDMRFIGIAYREWRKQRSGRLGTT